MARIRTVKPEYWEDEKIASLCRDARLLFVGLWNFADDEGRMRANPKYVKSKVFPYDDDVDVAELLCAIASFHLILRYTVDGQDYLWIVNFKKHQKIDRPQPSQLPPPPDDGASSPVSFDDNSTNDRGSIAVGMEWNGEGKGMDMDSARECVVDCGEPSMFTEFMQSYPKKADRKGALIEWRRACPNPQVAGEAIVGLKVQLAAGVFDVEDQFIPLARNYLKGERWRDEIPKRNGRKPPGGHTLQSMKDEIGQQLREQGIF